MTQLLFARTTIKHTCCRGIVALRRRQKNGFTAVGINVAQAEAQLRPVAANVVVRTVRLRDRQSKCTRRFRRRRRVLDVYTGHCKYRRRR